MAKLPIPTAQQVPIDLDSDGDAPAFVPIATATTMVAQHTLLPVAMMGRPLRPDGRARSCSPYGHPPETERGRGWIRAPELSPFHARHPSFAMSEASQSIPPAARQPAATPPRARARNTATAKDLEVESRFEQLERRANAAEERLKAAEQHIKATGQLAEKLDGFAAGMADYSGRLDRINTAHQKAIEMLADTLDEKLKTIRAAFDDCDRRLSELQQATYAAPAAGPTAPPGMAGPAGVAPLRGRLDELSREALTSGGQRAELYSKCQELDERLTAMDINVRAGQAEAACQLAQGMDAAQAQTMQRFAHVAQQIASLEYKAAAGACKCPASCPGNQAQRLPEPTAAGAAPEMPQACRGSDPLSGGRDAWSRWHRGGPGGGGGGGPGGGGGGGSGGGGGGGGRPDGGEDDNAEHFEFSDLTQDRPVTGRKPLTK